MNLFRVVPLSLLCLLLSGSAFSLQASTSPGSVSQEKSTAAFGMAMFGTPYYTAESPHFKYVNADAPKGGTLKVAQIGTFDSLNPFNVKGQIAAGFEIGVDMYFERLMKRSADEPFSLYGYIAEAVEVAPDRSWVEFTLRPQARWHDGTSITADDLIFSVEFFREHGRPNQRMYFSKIAEIIKKDDRRVRFTFKTEEDGSINPELPMLVALTTVIPKAEKDNPALKDVSLKPIMGSGPYKLKEVKPGHLIVLERDPNHWAKDLFVCKGVNNFDQIRQVYFRDGDVAFEALKAGDVDVFFEPDINHWVSAYNFPRVKKKEIVKVQLDKRYEFGQRSMIFNTRNPLFADLRVRKALSMLFDGNWINKTLYYGQARRMASYFENSPMAAPSQATPEIIALLTPYKDKLPQDIFEGNFAPDDKTPLRARFKTALKLLDEAGWKFEKGALLHKETGKPFAFEIMVKDETEQKLAEPFSKSLAAIGIKATLGLEKAQYEPRRAEYQFDMVFHLHGQSLSPGNEQAFYWSSEAAKKPGTRNYAGIQDPVVDEFCKRVAGAKDYTELTQAAKGLDFVLRSGYYAIPLFSTPEMIAVKATIGLPATEPHVRPDFRSWWQRVSND